MIKVGLTGNRFSGQDIICNMFKELGIPVFYADTILKFIINHNYLMLDRIKDRVGVHIFKNGHVESPLIKSRSEFDEIVDCAEFELMKSYDKFNKKHGSAIYTVFQSSILFERGWNKTNMDYNINVFCPRSNRISRSDMNIAKANTLLKNEITDCEKNNVADYVIHNYGICDLDAQIAEFDQLMIEKFIKKQQIINTSEGLFLKK